MLNKIKREFLIGDEWLYFKIFCAVSFSDKILQEIIEPISQEYKSKKIIVNWFFIRYNESGYHIRYRIKLTSNKYLAEIIDKLNQLINPFFEKHIVWKVEIHPYKREIERYGIHSINISEEIFFHDSNLILFLLEKEDRSESNIYRGLLSLYITNIYLTTFLKSENNIIEFLSVMRMTFLKEFNVDKSTKSNLDFEYRLNKDEIINFLDNNLFSNEHQIINFSKILNKEFIKLNNIYSSNRNKIIDLLISYIHMSTNRLFCSNNRLHEMITYDFLWRYYKRKINFRQNDQN